MIVIVVRFETDGDYTVDDKVAGLVSPPDDDYCHSGVFLCVDTRAAESVLEWVFKGIDAHGYLWQKFVQMFAEAQCALDDPDVMRSGWAQLLGGNYAGTLLFMQDATDWRGEPTKPVYQNNTADCPHTAPYCPTCGHILIDGNGDNFNFCPDCGQRIDWTV